LLTSAPTKPSRSSIAATAARLEASSVTSSWSSSQPSARSSSIAARLRALA